MDGFIQLPDIPWRLSPSDAGVLEGPHTQVLSTTQSEGDTAAPRHPSHMGSGMG